MAHIRLKLNYLYWAPRWLAIGFILFLTLFSLDSSGVGLLIHNIPSLALLLVLIIAWKYEIVGGIVFILVGLLSAVMLPSFIIAGPAFLIGTLFLINWRNHEKLRRG